MKQVLAALKKWKVKVKHQVHLLIVNDGIHVLVNDRKFGAPIQSSTEIVKVEPHFFLPLTGEERYGNSTKNEINKKASGKLVNLYDALFDNPSDWLEDESATTQKKLKGL